jgi:hypothetical protein
MDGPYAPAYYKKKGAKAKQNWLKNKARGKPTQIGKKVLGKVKQMLKAKRVSIRGTGKYGKRIAGRGDYSISEFGSALATPFFDDTRSQGTVNKVARFAGKSVGNMVGLGDEVGNATSWLSRAFGFGDYTIKKNSFQDYGNIAQFANHGTITFSHREYITDISSTTGFTNQAFPINPGNSTLFPWLSTIAKNFEQYEFLGLIFEFKSTSASAVGSVNTGLGTVIMATDYDVLDSPYADKRAMEVSEFATSAAPCSSQVHPIECDPKQNVMKQLFIQGGNSVNAYPDDPRFSALGNFQIATAGMQATSTIGELWVSYHIKLLKPQLEQSQTGSTTSLHVGVTTVPGGSPTLAYTNTTNPGAITATIASGRLRIVCTTTAGIGTYLVTLGVRENGTGTYSGTATPAPTFAGSAAYVTIAYNPSGVANSQVAIFPNMALTSALSTAAYANNPSAMSFVMKFQVVNDYYEVPMIYDAGFSTFLDLYMAPYNTSFITKPEESTPQLSKLLEMVEKLKLEQSLTNKQFIELKNELESDDDCYETVKDTISQDDEVRALKKTIEALKSGK